MPDYDVYVYEFKDEDLGENTYRVKLRFQTPHFRLLLIDNKPGWTMRAEHLYLNGRVVEDEVIAREYATRAAAIDDIESILEAAAVGKWAFFKRVERTPDNPETASGLAHHGAL